jgi:CheY-like chemotaxis protein
MANIALSESDPDVRNLLLILLEGLGHEATALNDANGIPAAADLLVLEPASSARLEQAQLARRRNPALPIISMSYLHEAALFLADGPLLHVEKPFTLAGFTEAVRAGLA